MDKFIINKYVFEAIEHLESIETQECEETENSIYKAEKLLEKIHLELFPNRLSDSKPH
tara:strand:- start:475 stop:648 length:174 start_codon:yes stop_codon:yes gene_type:complete